MVGALYVRKWISSWNFWFGFYEAGSHCAHNMSLGSKMVGALYVSEIFGQKKQNLEIHCNSRKTF